MNKEKYMHRRLLALGGGGATHGLDRPIDDFALRLVNRGRPRVGYLGWASANAGERLERLRAGLGDRISSLESLGGQACIEQARRWAHDCDLIYVAGGDTRKLLADLRVSGLDSVLGQAMDHGVLLVGVSAGASVWFDCALSDAGGQALGRLDGLGLFPGSFCPHYDSEPARRPAFETAVEHGRMPPGLALDDGMAVLVSTAGPLALCSGRPGARAWHVDAQGRSQTLELPDLEGKWTGVT
jgi:peptidase E